ncbi:MAG: cbb3-type cytochrome c oxidase subunit 3 [Devosia sp.]
METAFYDALRQFADSWGLVYMLGIFLVVLALIFRRGAKDSALEAARIPLDDDTPGGRIQP